MATCYRHPGRETNVSCASCDRPICPDCMTVTPVGMRCPECSRERTRVTTGVGSAGSSEAPVTFALMAICIAAFVAMVAAGGTLGGGRGPVSEEGGLFGPLVADGQVYRIVTSAFLHAGLFHLAVNMFVLFILGRMLEPAIGSLRFAGIYAVSVLGGSFGALLITPLALTVGASGGIFGLMAATFLIARDRGLDQLSQQIGLFIVLNLIITFSVPQISIGGHLGGLIGGGIAALVVSGLERRRVPHAGLLEGLALAAMGAAAIAGSLIAAAA